MRYIIKLAEGLYFHTEKATTNNKCEAAAYTSYRVAAKEAQKRHGAVMLQKGCPEVVG